MASDDHPKLPRATLRDEKLYVEGEKEPYFRDPEHLMILRVTALTVHRGYEPVNYTERAGDKVVTESIHGTAKLEGRDRLAVVGVETDRTTPIRFSLKPISDSAPKHHWRAFIGFSTYDWEFPDREVCFWVSGHCTKQYFEDVVAGIRRGHVGNIRVGMETTLWTKDELSMVRSPRTWHLTPPIIKDSRTDDPSLEQANISEMVLEEKFGLQPADEAKDNYVVTTPPPEPQPIELPARLYSMLTALVAIAAALLVLTFLRN